jgi:tight adherence protein B
VVAVSLNLAETLEALAEAMRRKIAIEGRIRALTAQGRLQGWAMGLLPLLCGAALWVIEPVAMSALLTTWYGWATCAFVALMQLLGLYFLRRVMRIDV